MQSSRPRPQRLRVRFATLGCGEANAPGGNATVRSLLTSQVSRGMPGRATGSHTGSRGQQAGEPGSGQEPHVASVGRNR